MFRLFLLVLFLVFSLYAQTYQNEELAAVGVSGAKVVPGTYRVTTDQRILDVIKMANGGKVPALDTIDCRNILLTSPSGKTDTLDLLRYLHSGESAQNPYASGGQSVRIGFASERVFLSGDIQGVLLGNIPLKKGESAADLLSFYTPNSTADMDHILFERIGQPAFEYSLAELSSVKLQNLDQITIFPVKDRNDLYRVKVSGEVKRPGIYSVVQGKTTAQELLEKAGGASAVGDPDEAWLVRKGKMQLIPEHQLSKGMESVKKEITNSAVNGTASGDFLIFPLRNGAIALEDGDEIVIPRRERLVYVSGLVKHPGGYAYSAGESVDHYIALAGGKTRQADRRGVKVVETYGDVYRSVDSDTVGSGDLILVPEKDKVRRTTFVLGLITSIASLAMSFTVFVQNQVK